MRQPKGRAILFGEHAATETFNSQTAPIALLVLASSRHTASTPAIWHIQKKLPASTATNVSAHCFQIVKFMMKPDHQIKIMERWPGAVYFWLHNVSRNVTCRAPFNPTWG